MSADNILSLYAKHVKNYDYTYKEDTGVDVDSERAYVSPMAQDIKAVAPFCVNTDPATGYEFVDTQRLAMLNAGAIGDLARVVAELCKVVLVSGGSNG